MIVLFKEEDILTQNIVICIENKAIRYWHSAGKAIFLFSILILSSRSGLWDTRGRGKIQTVLNTDNPKYGVLGMSMNPLYIIPSAREK